MFKIEKNVKIPESAGRQNKYPFKDMDVGDSFYVAFCTSQKVRGSLAHWSKKLGRKFITRAEDGGVRVWRIE